MDFVTLMMIIKQNWSKIPPDEREFFETFVPVAFKNIGFSRSQYFQDIWALYENDHYAIPYFVEFGAGDGKLNSNTYLLQNRYYWRGILAEPNPVWHEQLMERMGNSRNIHICTKCVFTETGKTLKFKSPIDPELGTISGYEQQDEHAKTRQEGVAEFEVETISLYDMLELYCSPNLISYMSVDTEGSEYDILHSFFHRNDKYQINCLSIEHNYIPEYREKIRILMESHGYVNRFPMISFCDDFYIKKELV